MCIKIIFYLISYQMTDFKLNEPSCNACVSDIEDSPRRRVRPRIDQPVDFMPHTRRSIEARMLQKLADHHYDDIGMDIDFLVAIDALHKKLN